MTDMPVRRGQRLQDVGIALREALDRGFGGRQQQADIRRERMTCSDSLSSSYQQTQDWTRGVEMSPSGRFQVVEKPQDRLPTFTRDTVRWSTAVTIIVVVAVVMALILLYEGLAIGSGQGRIDRLDGQISDYQNTNRELQDQLALKTGDISVCTEAVKYNLVASGGARTIQLTVPGTATLTFSASAEAGSAAEHLAAMWGD